MTGNTNDFGSGTSVKQVGPIAITCMKAEARDLLDKAVEAWKRDHPDQDIHDCGWGPYRTLYWLFRYSGIITYHKELKTEKETPDGP